MSDEIRQVFAEGPARAATPALGMTEQGRKPVSASSSTVLKVDRWGMRRGHELVDQWTEQGLVAPGETDPLITADAHAALFEPEPQFAENPIDQHRAAWWRQLMETPEYQGLHKQTCLDPSLASLGCKSLHDQWHEYAVELEQRPEQPGGGPGPAPGSDEESITDTMSRIRSTAKALEEARETVQAANDMVAGLGMGGAGNPLDPKLLADYFRRVRGDSMLSQIFAMAGRMRNLCRSLQRRKTIHGRDDTVGIELAGDAGRLIPSELAQLNCGVPELELLAIYRVATRQAMCRQYRGIDKVGRGPIVVVVDESGSMDGEKIVAAKGLALALAWLARNQKRWIAFVGFSGGEEGTRLAIPHAGGKQEELIDWLTHFYSGGTSMDVPMHELPSVYWPEFRKEGLPQGRTDVILITDAIVRCPEELRDSYLAWARAEQVRTYGIVIGESDAGDLAEVCDRHWCIPELSLDSQAVESVLSI